MESRAFRPPACRIASKPVAKSQARDRPLAAFNLPGFRLVFTNGMLSATALGVRLVVHGWLVLTLTNDSPLWVGVSAVLMGGSQVVFSVVAGVIVDRVQRQKLIIIGGLAGSAAAGVIAVTSYFSATTLWLALVIAAVMGAFQALTWTATHALLYDIAGPRRLLNASALWRLGLSPMMAVGSLAVGLLIAWAGIWSAYAFMGVAQLLAALVLIPLRVTGQVDLVGTSFASQIKEGIGYAAKDPPIRTLLTFSFLVESLGFSFLTMIPVMAKNVLNMGPLAMGFLSAATGVGGFIAVLAVAATAGAWRKPPVILVCAGAGGLALIGFSLSRSFPLSLVLAMLTLGCLMAYDLTLSTLLQLLAPLHMRGRIISIYSMAVALTSVGGFVMGAIGSVIGVPVALTIGGSVVVGQAVLRRRQVLDIREGSEREPT